MPEFLAAAALVILAVTAVALFRVLRSRVAAERMMAVQLLGTGGAGALLLLGAASGSPATIDVALLLALFAAFACVAFVLDPAEPAGEDSPEEQP
ncbi:monovalent cation/H+ antiporter complex subunit F [Bosea sp. BH3]|uniref:monovalent cation/H+ antiporter complex subunit F n=1 Tax=Bosea sp. BH3 TaxID=2871701 RepID=UPI0021CB055A|nr:monovalent cation/H+ antiporter complex subunit F [Bosea sp. BH3]MCU4180015.1 multiple resistance and pH regulation protein F [Bosea sp. BH3]